MHPIVIAIYFALCVVLGIAARGTRAGAIGVFLLSVIFTPLLVGIILAIARPLPKAKASKPSGNG